MKCFCTHTHTLSLSHQVVSCTLLGTCCYRYYDSYLLCYVIHRTGAFLTGVNGAGCPHCHGNFASCTFSSSGKCITVEAVAKNAGVLAGSAAGVLSLAGLIKPRFLRMMSNVAFETVVALVKRAEPGSAFEVIEPTGATEILNALANNFVNC